MKKFVKKYREELIKSLRKGNKGLDYTTAIDVLGLYNETFFNIWKAIDPESGPVLMSEKYPGGLEFFEKAIKNLEEAIVRTEYLYIHELDKSTKDWVISIVDFEIKRLSSILEALKIEDPKTYRNIEVPKLSRNHFQNLRRCPYGISSIKPEELEDLRKTFDIRGNSIVMFSNWFGFDEFIVGWFDDLPEWKKDYLPKIMVSEKITLETYKLLIDLAGIKYEKMGVDYIDVFSNNLEKIKEKFLRYNINSFPPYVIRLLFTILYKND